MDLETVSADAFGRTLRGVGVNLLCRDVRAVAGFAAQVLGLAVHRLGDDFALLEHAGTLIQLHSDRSFGAHPLLALVPEAGPRGGAVQLYLFGLDPDAACARAEAAAGAVVLEPPRDKPHGLREATILSPEGHAFSPAVARPE
ncbi:MAG: glyoxalase [Rhodobacteraceae bacterium]|nr:glyoxalase [Paracoccaceae bacterium]